MVDFKNISLKIKNYKCFDEDPQGFDKILPINILIGKNNSGKSSILDMLLALTEQQFDLNKYARNGKNVNLIITDTLDEDTIRRAFPEAAYGGGIPGQNHFQFGRHWIGKKIQYSVFKKTKKMEYIDPHPWDATYNTLGENILRFLKEPFGDIQVKKLKAERLIVPEADGKPEVNPNGAGATNIIQNFINKASLPSYFIEDFFLKQMNEILSPELFFSDLVVQQLQDGAWEIYLEEEKKGRVALSQSGSGLQTIILVLLFLYLVPKIENRELYNYFFIFEELENNLHPSLQRNLFSYLKNVALKNNTHFFITTHSNIVIDLFSKDEAAQIVHLQNVNNGTKIIPVTTYVEQKNILEDLDLRASDLLQSNGIIWVEGPSDRIYLNHWIKLWSDGTIYEGNHYQCVFYGGRLLSNILCDEAEGYEIEKYIKIININRNAIMIMDSDKKYKADSINATKKRIILEMKSMNAHTFITKGRTIENYIPSEAIEKYYKIVNVKAPDLYEEFDKYLDKLKYNEGKKFLRNKILFAERIKTYISKENYQKLNLADEMKVIIDKIKKWNNIK